MLTSRSKAKGMPTAVHQRAPADGRECVQGVIAFGALLYARRQTAQLTQSEAASAAGLSISYYSAIENGKRVPPPRRTAIRLARAIGLQGREIDLLVKVGIRERGSDRRDEDLPRDVQLLIDDLRVHAFVVPRRFIVALRTRLREAVP